MAQNIYNLPVGAKIKFGKFSSDQSNTAGHPIPWVIVAKGHQGYPLNSVTLLCEGVIDYLIFDGQERSGGGRASYGNSYYKLSNIDQWLNTDVAAGEWYSHQHEFDNPPPYKDKRGFLNLFTDGEKGLIVSTDVHIGIPNQDGGGYEYISRKIFLPSMIELGANPSDISKYGNEGIRWEYFTTSTKMMAKQWRYIRESYYDYDSNADAYVGYWTRSPYPTNPVLVGVITNDINSLYNIEYPTNRKGLRPALNLSPNASVSDAVDEDGCYVVLDNITPSSPVNLNIPNIYGGTLNTISWSAVTDPDGDSVSYELDCAYDGGGFLNIYKGGATTYAHFIESGHNSIVYRVRAVDSRGAYSEYNVSSSRSIVNNQSPVISGRDLYLGKRTNGFSQEYSVTDEDSESVTVTEAIDDVPIRSHPVTLGATNTFAVTGETWLKLTNDVHEMRIIATDDKGATSDRYYAFEKKVTSLFVQTNPMSVDTMPTRMSLRVTRNVPTESIFKIEVCNNANDATPTWEDATETITEDKVYLFGNTSKTADSWAVSVKITVDRNGAEGPCYISSIGGAFE